ncbi:MAG TPA: histone deacetylase [Chloroflexota bacterium]|nr:histone deacetylase [Chloroflexota bacterium]
MTASIALVTSREYQRHNTGSHPENAGRLQAIDRYLNETGLSARLGAIEPRRASDDDLLAVHRPEHLERIRRLAAQGGGMIDADTIVSPASDEVARLAAGGALAALDAVIAGGEQAPRSAFVLGRPPGHHAMTDVAMGFCLYNSVAIAARYAQKQYGLRRILVLDWDVHHGNGTQQIFYHDPSVLFISLHQYPLWPPGWGTVDQLGMDDGRGFSVNIPLPPGEGDAGYSLACERLVRPIVEQFRPELVLVSAGQDGHVADPISDMSLTAAGFAMLARTARDLAAGARAYGPVLLLEGGYNPNTLPFLVGSILDALGDLGLSISDPYARLVPVSDGARRRLDAVVEALGPWWTLS